MVDDDFSLFMILLVCLFSGIIIILNYVANPFGEMFVGGWQCGLFLFIIFIPALYFSVIGIDERCGNDG